MNFVQISRSVRLRLSILQGESFNRFSQKSMLARMRTDCIRRRPEDKPFGAVTPANARAFSTHKDIRRMDPRPRPLFAKRISPRSFLTAPPHRSPSLGQLLRCYRLGQSLRDAPTPLSPMRGGSPKCCTTRYGDALRYAHDLHRAQP